MNCITKEKLKIVYYHLIYLKIVCKLYVEFWPQCFAFCIPTILPHGFAVLHTVAVEGLERQISG